MIIEKSFLKEINFFIYKKKHLIIYIFIGILSLLIELGVRRLLIGIYNEESFLLHISIFFGIIFAFYFNIKFNFNVPKLYLKRSLVYFFIISLGSYIFQYFIKSNIYFENLNFEQIRFLVSGMFFLIAYFFHIKFSFKDSRKVGVAIYANGYENIKKIYEKIGLYPDFIHVDIVDETMNQNALDPKLSKVEVVKAYWPNHQIHTHIMSTNPLNCLDESVCKYSDIIYIHNESLDNKAEVINKIKKYGKIPGLVLHSVNDYDDLENIVKDFKEVLVLSIQKCGVSGQNFNKKSFDLIKKLNSLNQRKQFKVCVDGGVKSNLISKFSSERVVSGSDVLNNQNPKQQIMRLQTLSRYEK
jgi:pentose-5-phosphate-3-epimerase